jgi:hypothetical protein
MQLNSKFFEKCNTVIINNNGVQLDGCYDCLNFKLELNCNKINCFIANCAFSFSFDNTNIVYFLHDEAHANEFYHALKLMDSLVHKDIDFRITLYGDYVEEYTRSDIFYELSVRYLLS